MTDPQRESLVQWVRFHPLLGDPSSFHLHVLLAPHLGNRGANNTAWVDEYKGTPMLFSQGNGVALALASSAPWLGRSVGYVGVSDGWQDLHQHYRMTWFYRKAADGNIAAMGEIDWRAHAEEGVLLVLAFGLTPAEAGYRARATLQQPFSEIEAAYVQGWKAWQQGRRSLDASVGAARRIYPTSVAVLRTHEAKRFPGGMIASLSIPWGFAKSDDDLGGYHVVWPRDLVEAAGGLLAANDVDGAKRTLQYLQITQESDGHWPQNMWLDGTPLWTGIQMDETAFPILLADLLLRNGALAHDEVDLFWPMVRQAASFLVQNGPVTQQDRWEEDAGYSPFTLAVEIAALLAAADWADLNGEASAADFLRQTADAWNDSIERWTYVSGSELAQRLGVEGYYVRIAPPDAGDEASPLKGYVPIKNRPPGQDIAPAAHILSPDALALVRFGLRAPDDPRILNTVKAIDEILRVETPSGPAWYRYNGDGYGEHEDGSPYDGSGRGRLWPLLTGERAHYELAYGRLQEAERLLAAMESFANEGGMLPEQIWDAPDIPERELFFGKPTGSAMPLAWAHAEYVKLVRSLHDGAVFDMPPQTVQRYQIAKIRSRFSPWRFNQKRRTVSRSKRLRIETLQPAQIHWSHDDWRTVHDTPTRDARLGVHVAEIPTDTLAASHIVFTIYWPTTSRWEGRDFSVTVTDDDEDARP